MATDECIWIQLPLPPLPLVLLLPLPPLQLVLLPNVSTTTMARGKARENSSLDTSRLPGPRLALLLAPRNQAFNNNSVCMYVCV